MVVFGMKVEKMYPAYITIIRAIAHQKSMGFVSGLSKKEHENAVRRMRENAHVIAIVQQCLADRVASYHFALERLVIITPSPQAIEAERSITLLQKQIERYQQPAPTWVREPSLASTN